jgi:integrase
LTPEEYGKLGRALSQAERLGMNANILVAIVMLAFTGCRKSEILNLKPSEIDATGRCLRLEDSKSGPQMRPCGRAALNIPQMRPCGRAALNILSKLTLDGGKWVFPGGRGAGPLVNIRKALMLVCKLAELDGVTPHVLRHSYATVAHELGYSELTIAGLLGHRAGSVTARYAHHVDNALATAADRVAATIAARLKSGLIVSFDAVEPAGASLEQESRHRGGSARNPSVRKRTRRTTADGYDAEA